MHIHQSILDAATGNNIFSDKKGEPSPLFLNYIAGLERYTAAATLLFAPHVNSYRRLSRFMSAPTNVHWGYDNRTCGFRIPNSTPTNRRVENRVPGVDVNPYLAMAATLACGYLGTVSYTHLRAHETVLDLVCRLLLEKKKKIISHRSNH